MCPVGNPLGVPGSESVMRAEYAVVLGRPTTRSNSAPSRQAPSRSNDNVLSDLCMMTISILVASSGQDDRFIHIVSILNHFPKSFSCHVTQRTKQKNNRQIIPIFTMNNLFARLPFSKS